MAELSAKRVITLAAVVSLLVGGAVAAGVAAATSGGDATAASSPAVTTGSVATAAVVRTTLTNTVQVGGSIGYQGSYTVSVPSGTGAQQLSQAQQAVTEDQQTLSADQTAESDASSADNQAISAAQTTVNTDQSTLSSDKASESQDCAGTGASSTACNQDTQKVSEDQTQLTQADQQLAAAVANATSSENQDQAKVVADQTKLAGDQTTLTSLQASATNPGTTYTALPQVGDIIKEDQPVYSVSNQPVPLLYGSIAAYRAFYVGMTDGADVGELTADLIALGYGGGLAQSDHFSAATATAIERWQSALGLPATGQILLGAVVFEPGPIRVTTVTASVGESLGGSSSAASGGGGSVITATGTTPIVTVDLGVSEEYLVTPGDAVSVVLPDGTSTVGGHIATVGNVATCPGGTSTGTGGTGSGGSSADQSPCSSAGSNSDSTPTVPVTITLDSTPPGAVLDQAPVNVNITTQTASHVLAVPVNALLALQGGGFGVDVVTDRTSHLIGVTTGLYSNTLVQISGSGVTPGMRVEVPSS